MNRPYDDFAERNLPPREQWPDLVFNLPELAFPPRLNCVARLLDTQVAAGRGDAPCVIGARETYTYRQFQERVDRIAWVLVERLGMKRGGRVLIRGMNSPTMLAAILAVMKAGGIAVPTMAMLRARELAYPIAKAEIPLALCEAALVEELRGAQAMSPVLARIVTWSDGGLEAMMAEAPGHFEAADTAADEVCFIGFTSGTTGVPKGAVHFHREMIATCETFARHVLEPRASDRFIGSAPLAFTFGFGGHALFPMWCGASTVMIERAGPDDLLDAIPGYGATALFTAPTAYRAVLPKLPAGGFPTLRLCVSAGETLPAATFEAWRQATGINILDGLGSTEMLHIFVGSKPAEMRAGATGRVVPGYEAKIVDADGEAVADGMPGRLAVRGPTGCKYLGDPRQSVYVQRGWNITGDTYIRDTDGYFHYQARSDDMIISSGYNIGGPEVEAALLLHEAVAECAVIGWPDPDRGMIVKAFVVLRPGFTGDAAMVHALQEHAKATIAPYKYPRAVEFRDSLPKTPTGKLQRFKLREGA